MIKSCLCVMLGGGTGAVLRYLTTTVLNKYFNLHHWATFWVNVAGCFALGVLFQLLSAHSSLIQNLVIVGIIGSYTTFSAFEYENIDLIAYEKYLEFIRYSVFSCAFTFLALSCGFYVAKVLIKV